jgi:hypothetical protein
VASSSKFLFSNYGYVFLAMALCQTYGSFREPVYRNWILSGLLLVEVGATLLLTVKDWPLFDRWFELLGAELTSDYRRKLLLLGLANGLAFIAYERFFIPHKSLDDDPVTAAAPTVIVTTISADAPVKVAGVDGIDGKKQEGEEEEEEEEDASSVLTQSQQGRLWRCLNAWQPNCFLVRIGHKIPLYQKGALAFA